MSRSTWFFPVLTALLGVMYAWIGFSAHGAERIAALAGAVLVVSTIATTRWSRAAAIGLLLVGTVPLAVLTWWSVATPVLAVVTIAVGWPARRAQAADT